MKRESGKVVQSMIQGISFFVLIIFILLIMDDVRKIRGTARIINYTGIVRSSGQRIVKLEMAGLETPELMDYIESIMKELKTGGSKFNLIQLEDEFFQQKVDELMLYWPIVKKQMKLGKEIGWENTEIIDVSEKFYRMTNLTTRAAEYYVQKRISHLQKLQIITTIIIGIIGINIIVQSSIAFRVIRENKALHQKAYQDPVSGIYNRNYFNHHMQKVLENGLKYTLCYIDLDRLKYVNDNFGHDQGDKYIRVFVRFIKNEIREDDIFCRIGGDEFALVMVGSKERQVIYKLEDIRKRFMLEKENKYHGSFSYGVIEINESNAALKLEEILDCADKKMYQYKVSHKAQR